MLLIVLVVLLVLGHVAAGVCAYLSWCVMTGSTCVIVNKKVGIKPNMAQAYLWFMIAQSLLAVMYLGMLWGMYTA